jgi:hypothetical protein
VLTPCQNIEAKRQIVVFRRTNIDKVKMDFKKQDLKLDSFRPEEGIMTGFCE